MTLVSMRELEQILQYSRDDIHRLSDHAGRYYRPFDVRKVAGTGKWRHIDNPTPVLKQIQRRIQNKILRVYDYPQTMFGSIPARSIVGNAGEHVRKSLVVTLDIRDYFIKINDKMVFDAFVNVYGCSTEIASILTKLTTLQHRLPQGAPTSSSLANASAIRMHDEIKSICDKLGLSLSWYVDDIAFSGIRASEAIEPVIKVIQGHGFSIKRDKLKLMPSLSPQKVTGLTVNSCVSIGQAYKDNVMKDILTHGGEPSIPKSTFLSIVGRIRHVKRVNFLHGDRLERFAEKHLPLHIFETGKKFSGEKRPCTNIRRHTYHG